MRAFPSFHWAVALASAAVALSAYRNASAAMDSLDALAKCEEFAHGFATRDSMRPAGPPTDEQRKSVELSRAAGAFAMRGEYARAADLYREAYALWGKDEPCTNTDTAFALGISEYRAGRDLDAFHDLWEYLAHPDAPPEKVKAAEQTIRIIGSRIGHVNLGDTRGMSFEVDGGYHGHSRLKESPRHSPTTNGGSRDEIFDVTPGAHELSASRDEVHDGKLLRITWHASVVVKAGEEVTAVFEKTTAPAPPEAVVPAR